MTERLRVAVFNLYWSTFGGGEQVAGSIAAALAEQHQVDLLGPQPVDVAAMRERLGVELSGCGYREVVDDKTASEASADYDVFVNCTYLSTATNRAHIGLYYVHFPEPPVGARRRAMRAMWGMAASATAGASAKSGTIARLHGAFERRTVRRGWVGSYSTFLANSTFTAHWVTRLWKVEAQVLNPPVRAEVGPGVKRHVIAAVGRFFDPSRGHCKKQLDLVKAFVEVERAGVGDWRLVLVGGADAANREYALAVRREALGHAIDVRFNAPGAVLRETLASASLFWHGAGFGENANTHPERFEHFGIAVVEAMAAGAVPIVFGAAGPAEIVRHGVDGYHWHTPAELVALTRGLIADEATRATLSANAVERSREFTQKLFAARILRMVSDAAAVR